MRQFKSKSMLQLQGFESFLERLQEAGAAMETEGRKCFEQCAENLYDELYTKAQKAGLDERLLEQIDEKFIENKNANVWRYEVGWKKQKPTAGNPLPDVYKVMFYNYGTPKRAVKEGGQRVQIDGKWITLKDSRGEESAHPNGSHGFIKKAKLAVRNRNKKLQQETLEKILGELNK